MIIPDISVRTTDTLKPGEFAILHRDGLPRGVPCIAANIEGDSDSYLIMLDWPGESEVPFEPVFEESYGGVATHVPSARIEVDWRSVVSSAAAPGSTSKDALIGLGNKLLLRMRQGGYSRGLLDLRTGLISRTDLKGAWIAFERWRIVDDNDPALPLFQSVAWENLPK